MVKSKEEQREELVRGLRRLWVEQGKPECNDRNAFLPTVEKLAGMVLQNLPKYDDIEQCYLGPARFGESLVKDATGHVVKNGLLAQTEAAIKYLEMVGLIRVIDGKMVLRKVSE